MEFNRDFTVEPYRINPCHGQKRKFKHRLTKAEVMDSPKQFKNGPEIRAYWAEKKRNERANRKRQGEEDSQP